VSGFIRIIKTLTCEEFPISVHLNCGRFNRTDPSTDSQPPDEVSLDTVRARRYKQRH